MKLHPPAPKIDPTNPFKDALFGRDEFAGSLTRLLQNLSPSPVIFVNAPWGEGKTAFARRWKAALELQKIGVVHFDAYAADYTDDPFVSFTGEILQLIRERFPTVGAVTEREKEFKDAAVDVCKQLGGLGAKILVKTLSQGLVELADVKRLSESKDTLVDGMAEIGSSFVEKRIAGYTEEKDARKRFRENLERLALEVRRQQNFPLTILVDELDRCRPDFALGLLERIKHLFEVENVAFVLFVNQDQIESYVRTVYGIDAAESRAYLLKFATLFVDLPKRQPVGRYVPGHREFCTELAKHHIQQDQVEGWDSHTLGKYVGGLGAHFDLTLRETEKIFVILAIYAASSPRPHPVFGPFMATLKVKLPGVYERLRDGEIGLSEFSDAMRLKRMQDSDDIFSWTSDLFTFHLATDEELKAKGSIHWMLERFRKEGRQLVIPAHCAEIERFSVHMDRKQ